MAWDEYNLIHKINSKKNLSFDEIKNILISNLRNLSTVKITDENQINSNSGMMTIKGRIKSQIIHHTSNVSVSINENSTIIKVQGKAHAGNAFWIIYHILLMIITGGFYFVLFMIFMIMSKRKPREMFEDTFKFLDIEIASMAPTFPSHSTPQAIFDENSEVKKEWWYSKGDKKFGPHTSIELKSLVNAGRVGSNDLVWKEGFSNWIQASSVKNLIYSSMETPPPLPGNSNKPETAIAFPLPASSSFKKQGKTHMAKKLGLWTGGMFIVLIVLGIIVGLNEKHKNAFVQQISSSVPELPPPNIIKVGDFFSTPTFEIQILSTQARLSVGNPLFQSKPADGGIYIAVNWSYKNISQKPVNAFNRPTVHLKAPDGTTYDPDIGASMSYTTELDIDAKALSDLNPGIRVVDADVFEVSSQLFDPSSWKILVVGDQNTEVDFVAANKNNDDSGDKTINDTKATPALDTMDSMLGIKINDSDKALDSLTLPIIIKDTNGIKYRTENGNNFSVTIENGKIVYMENDWLHEQESKQSLISNFQFGETSLNEIRETLGKPEFLYENCIQTDEKGLILINCFQLGSSNEEVLVIGTRITPDANLDKDNVSELIISKAAKLEFIILSDKNYLDKIWGPARNFDANDLSDNAIDAPTIMVGDSYTYETENLSNSKLSYVATREVVAIEGNRLTVVTTNAKSGSKRTNYYDREWGYLGSGSSDNDGVSLSPAIKYLDFPLIIGKKWTAYSTEIDKKTGHQRQHKINGEVVGWETVYVPAGQFEALKIVLQTELKDDDKVAFGTDTSWYVPELHRSVKSELTGQDASTGAEEKKIIRLISYYIQ